MRRAKLNLFSKMCKALLWALLLGIIIAYVFGFRLILVNGWSSEPYIPYRSIIATGPTNLQDLKVGDFITYSSSKQSIFNFSNQSNVTHQIIAIKYNGYFVEGEDITYTIDGVEYNLKYGQMLDKEGNLVPLYITDEGGNSVVKTDEDGNVVYKRDGISTTCNIITMQRVNDKDFNADVSASKEFKNFNSVVGKVIGYNTSIGRSLFILMENKLILLGLGGCFVVLLVIKGQFSTENIRQYK